MIICISGLSGSGKNSVGEAVAKKLGMRLVNPTFKTIAAKQKMSLLDFHRKAEKEHSIDKQFDAHLVADANRGDCVVTTWLGPWMIKNADLRVWLYAPRESRAGRVAKRDGMAPEEALSHINERDDSNHSRYLEVYGVNIYDHSGFELVINTDQFLPEESADIICAAAKGKLVAHASVPTLLPQKASRAKKPAKKAAKKEAAKSKKRAAVPMRRNPRNPRPRRKRLQKRKQEKSN
jgi:CMP/dCMP kinase